MSLREGAAITKVYNVYESPVYAKTLKLLVHRGLVCVSFFLSFRAWMFSRLYNHNSMSLTA